MCSARIVLANFVAYLVRVRALIGVRVRVRAREMGVRVRVSIRLVHITCGRVRSHATPRRAAAHGTNGTKLAPACQLAD